MLCACGQVSHENQRTDFPIGSTVRITVPIPCNSIGDKSYGVGQIARVVGHCNDGRAQIMFPAGDVHTFHFPESCLRSEASDDVRRRILPLTRKNLRRGRRDIPFSSISQRDVMIDERKFFGADIVYLCDDDSQCVILKNRRGDTGFVSGETLLAEVGKIYSSVRCFNCPEQQEEIMLEGTRLSSARRLKKMSRRELAEKIHVTEKEIGDWEERVSWCDDKDVVLRLSMILSFPPAFFSGPEIEVLRVEETTL